MNLIWITKKKRMTGAIIAALLLTIFGFTWAVRDRHVLKKNSEDLTIGTPTTDNCTLIYLASERGYFRDQGLNVVLKTYHYGVQAADALARDEVDLAAAADFVFVNHVVNNDGFKTFGTIAATNNIELLARKDRIERPEDLKGKRIGVTRRSILEFFLGTFLAFHDLPLSAVYIVDLETPDMKEALFQGRVDAVITSNPYIFQIKRRMGEKVVSWPAQHEQDYYFLLMCKSPFTETRPQTVNKLLRALVQAEEYVTKHPAESRMIMQKKLNLKPEEVGVMWRQNLFQVRLPQNLLFLMEDETRWMQQVQGRNISMPDYLPVVYLRGLEEVQPEAVGIIH